ncbi:MAG: hypothetical protein RR829_00385 [Oscillospiraceae bacterium]
MAGITFSKSSNVNDSVFGKSQEPIKMFLEKKAEAFEANSVINKVFSMDTSNNAMEKYTSMTSMNGFQPVGEGGSYPNDEMQEGNSKVLEHVTWKDSFKITQEMVEDSKTIDFKKAPTAFMNGYGRTREQFGAALIGGAISGAAVNFAGSSFSTACADGKSLFAADHGAKLKGAAQSNKFADAFSNDALTKLECRMQDFRDDNHNVLAVSPDIIVIPNIASLKQNVFAAIGADKDPATANNGFNFQFGRWTIVVWQYLNQFIAAGTAPWILLDSTYNEEVGTAVWLDRVKLSVKSTVDDNTDNNVWRGRSRFIAGFKDWRGMAVSGVSGATNL